MMQNNHIPQTTKITSNKKLLFTGWALSLLFVVKALDFFLSIDLTGESEFYPMIFAVTLFAISGSALLLLAWGVAQQLRWVRTSLYVVFVANAFLLAYSVFMVTNWFNAGISLIGAVLLWYYLSQTRNLQRGRRHIVLQVITILTLLPATIFISLSVLFPDETLQDDTPLRLQDVPLLTESQNLYVTLANRGTELPEAAEQAQQLIEDYPAQWDQDGANALILELQPYINTYSSAANINGYQCSASVNDFSLQAEICQLNLLRDYAQLMQFAAITEAEQGNLELAQEYALSPIEAGTTMIESNNVTLIEYLIGLASVNIGLDTIDNLVQQDLLTNEDASGLLQDTTISTKTLSTPLQREYLGLKLALDDNFNMQQSYLYHPNRTRNELYEFMSLAVNGATTPCGTTLPSHSNGERILNDIREKTLNPTRPNIIGNMYLAIVMSSLSGARNNVCEANQRIAEYTN